ncbi:MAG: type II/IV secretion system ATPase subunit [Methanomicrobium sp.]|nr:type II/IV secretion system ATPase subunit [Methanomicrobium sp.]
MWSESDSEIDDKKAGLVSVNEIDESYSGLILPEGATFEIEEFKVKSLNRELEPEEHNVTISKIDKIYSEYFPPIDLDKLNEIDLSETKIKEKSGLFKKLKQDKKDKYEYNPSIHGPIVDLSFKEAEGVEEVELYPVNEPYAYVRIIFDKNTNEYIYKAIEPVLNDAENKLLLEIEQRLFETLDVNTKDMTKDKAREILKFSVNEIIADYGLKLNPPERAKIIYHINREFLGDGIIDPIMHDKYIEDISCDGLNTPIFVFHSNYESIQTNLLYKEAAVLDSFVTRLAQRSGKYISIAEPMLDATMSDGSRIQMTLGTEVTAHGSTFTIRKFKDEPITPTDLTEWGTFSPLSIAYIWLAVEAGKSCIFAGGTASGKTTSLNAISLFIPPLAKIVTLEDTRELKLPHLNWIPSITRESFDKDGKGSIDMYELLRAALRQRPEYILVGEVRGAEAQTLFQAMSTGHVTYSTMHADSVASAVHRIENPPLNVPRNMLSSLDLMSVQVQARIGGQRIRRNKQLIEILDIDQRTKELITNEAFRWHQSTDEIKYSGKSYILEDIMESRGWDEARMVEELKRRQEILEWMRLKKLRNYKDVGKVLMSYYRDSEAVIKLVREDLYE